MMKFKIALFSLFAGILLFVAGTAPTQTVSAAPAADCLNTGTGAMVDLGSWSFTITCSAPSTVYFGVCDSGSARLDDFLNIEFDGSIVAWNSGTDGDEDITFGSAQIPAAGDHAVTINSVSDGSGPVTFAFSASSDLNEAFQNAQLRCGTDYNATSPTVLAPVLPATPPAEPTTDSEPTTEAEAPPLCVVSVPLFTEDTSPSAGTLMFMSGFGAGSTQPEGTTVATWKIGEGQRLNNAPALIETPHHARLWWQPEGSDDWYLLPSQYWQGDGTTASEYGASCVAGIPSYHTSFASAIVSSDLP